MIGKIIAKIKNITSKLFFKKLYKKTYSQCGEDVIIEFLFGMMGIKQPNYLDIGANEPIKFNNTYYFFKNKGSKGVLIEPNPMLAPALKSKRTGDTLLSCGIGFNNKEEEADFYVMDWHVFNTFSKEAAYETQEIYKGRNNVKEVIRVKLIPINNVLKNYFAKGLDLLSIDVEGLDLEILSTIDFSIVTPKVICAETKVGLNNNASAIADFLATKGYRLYSQTPINGIFVHQNYLKKS
jgi:FkbM family methyltransferase